MLAHPKCERFRDYHRGARIARTGAVAQERVHRLYPGILGRGQAGPAQRGRSCDAGDADQGAFGVREVTDNKTIR